MHHSIKRKLDLNLPKHQSAFLWGARKTGKTTYLKEHFPNAQFFDLLKSDIYLKFLKNPHLFREEILAALAINAQNQTFIVDEIQKVPVLLDEVHWLIENTDAQFILCGSSARKMRQKGVNLLGGRAWKYHFFPLVHCEIQEFDLLKALTQGLIPSHYLSHQPKKFLKSYVEDYIIQEIRAEGLVRNLSAFSRFLEAASYSNSEMVNYANIARDCGVDAKTVKEYFQILKDTLIAYEIEPYRKRGKRDIISSVPKFYFFDPGVANTLAKRQLTSLQGSDAGKSFEGYILHELNAYKHITDSDYTISYWRTKTGLEVDFVISEADLAIEVKISKDVRKVELKGLVALMEEQNLSKSYVVCNEEIPRKISMGSKGEIWVLPFQHFLRQLWNGDIL